MATIPEALEIAIAHQRDGRLRDAEAAFREILARDPSNVESLNNLGNLLGDLGQFPEAVACLDKVLTLRPDLAPVHFNLGNVLRSAGSPDRAMASYRQALAIAPTFTAAYKNLAMVQKAVGDLTGAERSLNAALDIDPADAEAHYNRALLRVHCGDPDGARAGYLRALELRPDNPAVHYNLGIVLLSQHDWDAARHHFREALRLRPRYAQPHCHLGLMLMAQGEDDAALAHFAEALAIDPQCAEAHANRGAILLARGDYKAGWPEYAWSRKCDVSAERKVDLPEWDGEPLLGRTILAHGSHGLGDTLQFVRFLPEIRNRGAGRVLLAVPDAVRPLVSDAGLGELVSPHGPLPRCEVAVALLDLPCVLRPTAATIPPAPYLRADASLVAQWRKSLQPLGGFQVGVVWQGNRNFAWDHLRSIALARFAPLAGVPGVRLISLQKGDGCEQLAELDERFSVTDLGDVENRSLADTAAIIANLDLVIASDTAVAHLAGALGAPVWVALPRGADWRWQRTGETTPWYATMRLFRQAAVGQWEDVFTAMAAALRELVAARVA